jgi:hypothetical protein
LQNKRKRVNCPTLDKQKQEKQMSEDSIPIDKLVKIYRKIKMEIDTMTQEYDTKLEILKGQQDEIKFEIKDQMKALGVTSVKSPFGTVSMRTSTTYTTNDWASFKDFILEHGAVDLLFKRIAQANMAQFLEENPGVVPPGLNSVTEFNIVVTKPTK